MGAVMQTGRLLMQWPVGGLSDGYERRVVILTASLVVAASSLAIALVGGIRPLALYPLAALWGGCALSIYAICLAHAGDFAEPHQMVPLASSLLLSWAAGAAAGPRSEEQPSELQSLMRISYAVFCLQKQIK